MFSRILWMKGRPLSPAVHSACFKPFLNVFLLNLKHVKPRFWVTVNALEGVNLLLTTDFLFSFYEMGIFDWTHVV